MKFTILTILSVQFNSGKYIYIAVQQRVFQNSSWKSKTVLIKYPNYSCRLF